MPRINVPTPDRRHTGYFDSDAATRYDEDFEWLNGNKISTATDTEWDHEALYRTKGGRWVLNAWSQRQGVKETYRFIDGDQAKDWLLRNEQDEAAEKWFGELEDEVGPAVGRPEIGGRIDVMIGEELRKVVDAHAKALGMNRGEAVRLLLADALNFGKPSAAATQGSDS